MAENAYKYGLDSGEMFVLGLLHDIGYLNGREGHEMSGYALLDGMGLNKRFTNAILLHGSNPHTLTDVSPELRLLYEADMSIDKDGKLVGFKGRLKDIKERYGADSIAYKTASDTVDYLKEQNDKDLLEEYELEQEIFEEGKE
jgi:hypothetical protein